MLSRHSTLRLSFFSFPPGLSLSIQTHGGPLREMPCLAGQVRHGQLQRSRRERRESIDVVVEGHAVAVAAAESSSSSSTPPFRSSRRARLGQRRQGRRTAAARASATWQARKRPGHGILPPSPAEIELPLAAAARRSKQRRRVRPEQRPLPLQQQQQQQQKRQPPAPSKLHDDDHE